METTGVIDFSKSQFPKQSQLMNTEASGSENVNSPTSQISSGILQSQKCCFELCLTNPATPRESSAVRSPAVSDSITPENAELMHNQIAECPPSFQVNTNATQNSLPNSEVLLPRIEDHNNDDLNVDNSEVEILAVVIRQCQVSTSTNPQSVLEMMVQIKVK